MLPKIKNFAESMSNRMLNVVEQYATGQQLSSKNSWKCSRCTLINSISRLSCEACDNQCPSSQSPKLNETIWIIDDDSPPQPSVLPTPTATNSNATNIKICDLCTTRNNSSALKCDFCGYKWNNNEETRNNTSFNRIESARGQKATSIGESYTNDELRAKENSTKIIEFCTKERIKFVDDSFPPCDKSLFLRGRPEKFKSQNIIWRSPNEIHVPREDERLDWVIFRKPNFNDIKQGLLGNCWFLSALAVIIEQPELLNKILITKSFCTQGVYQIRLCFNGQWKTVIIDDLFPCDEWNRLINAKAVRKQLWVILVEKALAKLNGSYEALIGGHTVEGLATLTGYPCEMIEINDKQDFEIIWAQLLSYKDAGFLLGVSCGKSGLSEEEFSRCGLLSNHAYSILDIKQYNQYRLLKIRNPWGHLSWNGKWSNKSTIWTPQLRQAINGTNRANTEDEGIFWMEYDDFIQYFNTIDVCKIRSNWMENRISGNFASHDSRDIQTFHLIVFENCLIDLTLFQQNSKNRRESNDLDLSFLVVRYGQPIGRLVMHSKRLVRKFISQEHIFEPGEYLIVPLSFNFWYSSDAMLNDQFNLVLHGSKSFFIEPEIYTNNLLADSLIELCLRKGKKVEMSVQGANIYSLTHEYSGLVVMAENLNTSGMFTVEINATNSINVVSTRQTLLTSDTIQPLHRQILLVLTHFESGDGYMLDYTYRSKFSHSLLGNNYAQEHQPALNRYTQGLHGPRHV